MIKCILYVTVQMVEIRETKLYAKWFDSLEIETLRRESRFGFKGLHLGIREM